MTSYQQVFVTARAILDGANTDEEIAERTTVPLAVVRQISPLAHTVVERANPESLSRFEAIRQLQHWTHHFTSGAYERCQRCGFTG